MTSYSTIRTFIVASHLAELSVRENMMQSISAVYPRASYIALRSAYLSRMFLLATSPSCASSSRTSAPSLLSSCSSALCSALLVSLEKFQTLLIPCCRNCVTFAKGTQERAISLLHPSAVTFAPMALQRSIAAYATEDV